MNIIRSAFGKRTEYFKPTQKNGHLAFANSILQMMEEQDAFDRELVVVCIGTDRATGDALGPLVGDYILSQNTDFHIAGTLKSPVHALNIKETIQNIYSQFYNPFVIAVDASLGLSKDIGLVTLTNSHLYPGKGVNKKLPAIGNISITGIVNQSGYPGANLLQNTRLYTVKTMADFIGESLLYTNDYLSSPL